MDILTAIYLHAIALSALAVVVLHQALKLKAVPWKFFNRYPVPGLILLSAGASAFADWKLGIHPQSLQDWTILGSTIAVSAGLTYNATIKNWKELREMESSPQATPPSA